MSNSAFLYKPIWKEKLKVVKDQWHKTHPASLLLSYSKIEQASERKAVDWHVDYTGLYCTQHCKKHCLNLVQIFNHSTLALNFCSWVTGKSFFFPKGTICWEPWISQVQNNALPSTFLRAQPCRKALDHKNSLKWWCQWKNGFGGESSSLLSVSQSVMPLSCN